MRLRLGFVGEERPDQLVERGLVTTRHDARGHGPHRCRPRHAHGERHLAEVRPGVEDARRPTAAKPADGEHTGEDDVEAVTGLSLDDGSCARRNLLASHALRELVQPLTGQLGEQGAPRQFGHRRGYMARAHTPILARVGRLVGWNHCPRCAGRLDSDGARACCAACGFVAYAHSDPTACALVFDSDGSVLLARRAREPDKGKWDVPGGFIEEGEQPLDALRRELLEETGLEIEPIDFVGAWVDRYGDAEDAPSTLNLYWTARIVSGEPEAADDVSELAWFPLDSLPPDSDLAFSNVAEALRSWRS